MIYHKTQKIQATSLDFLFCLRRHIEKAIRTCYNIRKNLPIWQSFGKGGEIMVGAAEANAMNLYILSNYEKARLCTSRPISAGEKKRLKTSAEIMSAILCGLAGGNCDAERINAFIDSNKGKIFPIDCNRCEAVCGADYSEKQREILGKMTSLLYSIEAILSKPRIRKSERMELYCLLHAFHNLPRALLDCSSKLYISPDDAVQYADEWLSRVQASPAEN